MDSLEQAIATITEVLDPSFTLGWNLFLAAIPLILSLLLFRVPHKLGWWWWVGLAVFVAFLPNAPYVLTDFTHFFIRLEMSPPLPFWLIAFVRLPQLAIYFFLGFQAYVIALINLGEYLHDKEWDRWIRLTEIGLHWLCAIGIYLGRFERFNSWELLTQPQAIFSAIFQAFLNPLSAGAIIVAFLILTVLYYIVKFIDLTLMQAWRKNPSN